VGVDPRTNDRPAGRVLDSQTSSPVVLPDDTILYGAFTYWDGHLFKLSPTGDVLATFDAGFDSTPPAFQHDGTYSIVVKHNSDASVLSLDANLQLEWAFVSGNTLSCTRHTDGSVTCIDDHPDGFEWCVTQPAMDVAGTAFANSDDGHLYAIDRTGTLRDSIFLDVTLGAAYSPVAIGGDGLVYAQNSGHLIAAGSVPQGH
jgi:outer membrane protein assembly factor BamB